MEITKELPFDWCDTCPKFELDAQINDLWVGDKVYHGIIIFCANRHTCKNCVENMERTNKQKGGEAEH